MHGELPRRFDRRAVRWSMLVLLGTCAGILVAIPLGLTVEEVNRVGAVACVAAGAVAAWFAVAFFRQRLTADSVGVHVRNLFSSFTVPWADVERFEHPVPQFSSAGLRGHHGLRIVLVGGQVRYASLWGENRLNRQGFAQPVVDELNRLKQRR